MSERVGAESLERRARERAHYLQRTTVLTEPESWALAYSELGFSYRGVAKQLNSTEGTVQQYLERAAATYGPHVAQCRHCFDVEIDLEPVERADTENWIRDTQERWFSLCEQYPDRAPDWYFTGGETR